MAGSNLRPQAAEKESGKMNRIVKTITLTPWALLCIQGALRRDAKAQRALGDKAKEKPNGALEIAHDNECLASLLQGLDVGSIASVELVVHGKKAGA